MAGTSPAMTRIGWGLKTAQITRRFWSAWWARRVPRRFSTLPGYDTEAVMAGLVPAIHGLRCRLRRRGEDLRLAERGEEAALRHQRIEAAAFDDAAPVEDEDAVGIPDRGQPVGDDEGGASSHHLGKGTRHFRFGGGIE